MNQREIRFRVWVPKRRYSLPEEGIDDTPCMYTWDCDAMEIAWLLSGESNNGWIDPVVMQYTGLKDESGKEIYEGDIVKVQNSQGVGMSKDEVVWSNVTHGWMLQSKTHFDVPLFQGVAYEIIGNIYSGPH